MAEIPKISVYSLPDLKNTSDDALPNYLNSLGFAQSHFYTDVRLALGYSAVAIAGALFYFDWKLGWDVTRAWTLPAVLAYVVLNAAFTYWLFRVERGVVYVGERKGVKMLIATSSSNDGPSYVVSAKVGKAAQSTWKETKIEAPFSRWFSADGYFIAKPFQQFLAGGIALVGEADPKNAVEEVVRVEKPTAVPLGSNLNVNIQDLPGVLEAIKSQNLGGGAAKRRKG